MKKSILLSTAAIAVMALMSGCASNTESTKAAAETGTAEETEAEDVSESKADANSDAETAEESENESEDAENGSKTLKSMTLTVHREDENDLNFVFKYDDEGRLLEAGCYQDKAEAPDEASEDNTLYASYDDNGVGTLNYREEYLAAIPEEDEIKPAVDEVKNFDDGRISYFYAGYDAAFISEFNDAGLPMYVTLTQDTGDYAIAYETKEDGTYTFEGAVYENPGHFDADADENPDNAEAAGISFDGKVEYR